MARERVTVEIALPARWWKSVGKRFAVEGYACEVAGLPMVVHRSLMRPRKGDHKPRLGTTYWNVTEPRTGHAIFGWHRSTTIADAIDSAAAAVLANGGPEAVEKRVRYLTQSREVAA